MKDIELTPEQIENIREKDPEFDFEKFLRWKRYIHQEVIKTAKNTLRKGCEL